MLTCQDKIIVSRFGNDNLIAGSRKSCGGVHSLGRISGVLVPWAASVVQVHAALYTVVLEYLCSSGKYGT